MSLSRFTMAALAAGLLAVSATAADAARSCFLSIDWQGWKAPDANTIYLKVNNRDVYRVDLSVGSSRLMAPGVHLDSVVRGSNTICSAIDLDLKVSDSSGLATPLIAKTLTKLTSEEAAAIPRRYRP